MIEVDGAPMAYMELHDGFGFVRFVYRTIRFECGTEETARRFVEHIREELRYHLKDDGIVLWRHRPEIEGSRVYMRLATSPPIPEAFWSRYMTREGEPTRSLEELRCQ